MITGFDSVRDYFRFAAAKEYRRIDAEYTTYEEKNIIEKIGDVFAFILHRSTDSLVKNIKSPAFILGVSMLSSGVVTFVIYPQWTSETIMYFAPGISMITPEIIRKVGFVFTEATILGYTMRTLGRLTNSELMEQWSRREIIPIYAGGEVLTVQNQ